MDNLSPEAQILALKYLIEQDSLNKASSNAGYFFSIFFAFIFGAMAMKLWDHLGGQQ